MELTKKKKKKKFNLKFFNQILFKNIKKEFLLFLKLQKKYSIQHFPIVVRKARKIHKDF